MAVVIASDLVDRDPRSNTVSGTLIEFLRHEAIGINIGTPLEARWLRFTLRDRTTFEGFPGGASPVLAPGTRVEITFRSVGEERPVADRVLRLEAK